MSEVEKNNTEQEIVKTEAAPVLAPGSAGSVWTDPIAFNRLLHSAKVLSQSDLVPDAYRGKPQNCLIALDMAVRMNMHPLQVMQNLYVVKGKPSWSGQACIAMIHACGRFAGINLEYVGEPGTDSWGCRMVALRLSDGERVVGTTITIAMAKGEGWLSNSKWKTMPQQMLGYRAAAFFARLYCPDALVGLQTYEEVVDADERSAGGSELTDALNCETVEEEVN